MSNVLFFGIGRSILEWFKHELRLTKTRVVHPPNSFFNPLPMEQDDARGIFPASSAVTQQMSVQKAALMHSSSVTL